MKEKELRRSMAVFTNRYVMKLTDLTATTKYGIMKNRT